MGRKWKGITRIGLMAGVELGADFFKPWRAEKARKNFVEKDIDFIIVPGGLLNLESLNEEMEAWIADRKSTDKTYKLTQEDRWIFCEKIIKQILEDVFPPICGSDKQQIKYWLFPCPLFELKRDKYGIAAYVYENLEHASLLRGKRQDPYIRVGDAKELVEVEDDVAIRTLGVIMPSTSFFRAKFFPRR